MGQALAVAPQALFSLWSSGPRYQVSRVLELEGCRVPGAGMALVSGARDLNGEGRRDCARSLGLAAPSRGDPGMPLNVQEAGDLPRLSGLREEPRKLGARAGGQEWAFCRGGD